MLSRIEQVGSYPRRPTIWLRRILLAALSCFSLSLFGASIVGSSHDLSTGSSPEVCIFCHTPHNANTAAAPPLWNRAIDDSNFTMYSSDTLDSVMPNVPSPRSLLCLGCHDGVLTYIDVGGNTVSTKHDLVYYHGTPDTLSYPNCARCHPGYYGYPPTNYKLGKDLSNDHPISMDYPTGLVDSEFNIPLDAANGWASDVVMLFDGKIECASCHEVHDPAIVPFLRMANNDSQLCLICHNK